MSLKVLDIVVKRFLFRERKIGFIILNGPSATILKKFRINPPYDGMITRKNLLKEGNQYCFLDYDEYVSRIERGLHEDLKKTISLRERNLTLSTRGKLIRYYVNS